MVESALLGVLGGVVGLALGYFGLEALKSLGGDTFHQWRSVTLSGRTLVVTALLSVVTSLLFGLVPAWHAGRFDLNIALSEGGSRGAAGRSRHWTGRVLVAAEVALGVVLLVVSGLLVHTFVNLRQLNPGFDPTNLTTASVSLQDARYKSPEAIVHLFDTSLDDIRRTPGVTSAA